MLQQKECTSNRSMSFPSYPSSVPDRDNLPQVKSDQSLCSPLHNSHCDSAIFKVPYPYKRHNSPFQPVPRRVRPLHQPWLRTHIRSAFTEYQQLAELNYVQSQQSGWSLSNFYQQHPHLSRPTDYPQQTSVTFESPALHNGSHFKSKLQCAEKEANGRGQGLCIQRIDIKSICTVENTSLMSQSRYSSQSADYAFERPQSRKLKKLLQHPIIEVPSREKEQGVPLTDSTQTRSAAPNALPWLLPHFEAGSLIELRDGRLRRVENLQTEDFLMGSLACPDLRLSCCTVQKISPSDLSASVCRLLILLHGARSQEVVDVHAEYPFFVRGQGWSSCCPLRTARLCGLRCRQLTVGDVCLALTPISAPQPPACKEPQTPPGWTERCDKPLLPPRLQTSPSGERRPEEVRKRHSSAPS